MNTEFRMWSNLNWSLLMPLAWRSEIMGEGQLCVEHSIDEIQSVWKYSVPSYLPSHEKGKHTGFNEWNKGKVRCRVKVNYKSSLLTFESPSCLTYTRWRLQVFNLQLAQQNFWNVWVGTEDGIFSSDVIKKTQPVVYHPR